VNDSYQSRSPFFKQKSRKYEIVNGTLQSTVFTPTVCIFEANPKINHSLFGKSRRTQFIIQNKSWSPEGINFVVKIEQSFPSVPDVGATLGRSRREIDQLDASSSPYPPILSSRSWGTIYNPILSIDSFLINRSTLYLPIDPPQHMNFFMPQNAVVLSVVSHFGNHTDA